MTDHTPDRHRILIIEDNTDFSEGVVYNLEREGMDARAVETVAEGVHLAEAWAPHVIVLDLMLPDGDGYHVLEKLRADGNRVPVMVLTARAEEAEKVRGFRLDADQYVTKPVALLELIERVKSLARRGAAIAAAHDTFEFGDIVVDTSARTVTRAGHPVSLTPKAFELLLALARRGGAAASRRDLLREVWGHRALVMTRTVDSHVAELRRKLEANPAEPRHIVTVWKVGYRLEA